MRTTITLAMLLVGIASAQAETCATQNGDVPSQCRCAPGDKRISQGALCSVQRPEQRAAGIPSCFEEYECRAASAAPAKPARVLVFLDWGISTLTPKADEVVAAALTYVKPSSRISVVGHADRSEAQPAELSRARAEAVRASLIQAGVSRRAIVRVEGGGTKGLLVQTSAGQREPQNRFVEIIIR